MGQAGPNWAVLAEPSRREPLEAYGTLLELAASLTNADVKLVLEVAVQVSNTPDIAARVMAARPLEVMDRDAVGAADEDFWCGVPVHEDDALVGALLFFAEPDREAPKGGLLEQLKMLARTAGTIATGLKFEFEATERGRLMDMIQETTGVSWWRVDPDAETLEGPPKLMQMHGAEPGEPRVSMERALGIYTEEARAFILENNQKAMETGEGFQFQTVLKPYNSDKSRIVVSRSSVERDALGNHKTIYGVMQDITEQEKLFAELRRNESRYRLLAENTSDVITRVKIDGSSKYISPAIQQLLGWSVEEMTGRALEYVHPEDRLKAVTALMRALQTGETTLLVNRALHRDGSIVWCECTAKALHSADGKPEDVVVVIRDISQRKALEMELTEAKERAEAATRAKSDFLANMSHELRTPLTSVVGYSDLLRNAEDLSAEHRLYAERISTSSEALLQVINDILDYSKLEAGAVEIDKAPFELVKHLEETVGIIERQVEAKGLGLKVMLDPRLPEVLAGDASRLRQVTLNFLSNAVKFTSTGEIVVKCYGAETMDGRFRVRVEVTDTGIGLSPEKADLIFGRFTQADASTTRLYGGTGLGLAISRRLMELMDGEIGYDSAPGKGATFWYEVPLDFDVSLPVSVAADTVPQIGAKGRILMVDDAEANRELVSIILQTLGLEVETACDGIEAVEAVRRSDFDLVLMDVHMPQMDGLAATREIRLMQREKPLPILALTANVSSDQVQKCLDAGMDGHLPKPIQVAELARVLKAWLMD